MNLYFYLARKTGELTLELAEVELTDLIGRNVVIRSENDNQIKGMVVRVNEKRVLPELIKAGNVVETNVRLTIQDEMENEHTGTLLVDFKDQIWKNN